MSGAAEMARDPSAPWPPYQHWPPPSNELDREVEEVIFQAMSAAVRGWPPTMSEWRPIGATRYSAVGWVLPPVRLGPSCIHDAGDSG
jgi:hypothetical protein